MPRQPAGPHYEWDPAKAKANLAKHGVAFEAAESFDWDKAIVRFDDEHSDTEDRWIAAGLIGAVLHIMVFTERGGAIRIIGLRKATKQEEKHYARKC